MCVLTTTLATKPKTNKLAVDKYRDHLPRLVCQGLAVHPSPQRWCSPCAILGVAVAYYAIRVSPCLLFSSKKQVPPPASTSVREWGRDESVGDCERLYCVHASDLEAEEG